MCKITTYDMVKELCEKCQRIILWWSIYWEYEFDRVYKRVHIQTDDLFVFSGEVLNDDEDYE